MPIEAVLIKPVVDVLLALFRQAEDLTLKRDAEAAVREAIRELLQANPNESRTAARIAVARAAGILGEDVILAETMLEKHRAARARTRGKTATGRRRTAAPAGGAASAAEEPPRQGAPAKKAANARSRRGPRKPGAS
ncbi:hypothetical protein H0E84_10715 [Luteimonas sp. SJ-92]|uniref:Uncharacterized protein n=1 Tax=Luteimonas salinisoli TaxID=2752307 RepID=A0A853JE39_9GAMM|nr:hypothetical protein [Luteimonas salinisoli]NZA26857.1 hypothetical protein [Luteimonas salinisoli]